jgi:hypothetical protein
MTVKHMQHMHTSLDQMNLPLHQVISDVTGVTGRRILRAMIAGERAPQVFATSRDSRIQSAQDPIAKALEGDERPEHVFTLTPSLALYDFPQPQSAACDQDIERGLGPFDSLVAVRREAVWKNVETPLGIQVPNEPLERSIIDHSMV